MTPADDNWHAMTRLPSHLRGSRERDLDRVGAGGRPQGQDLQPVAAFLLQLRGLGELSAPRPSDELASVLTHGFAPPEAARTAPSGNRHARSGWWRRGVVAFGLSAGLSASLVGAAAASDRLPDRAQDVLERFVETVTPFEVHDPRAASPRGDDLEPEAAVMGEEPNARLATSQQTASPEEPDGDATTTVGKRSKGKDIPTRTGEGESGSQRAGDDGEDRVAQRDSEQRDPVGAGPGDDGDADHEFSGGALEVGSEDPEPEPGSDTGPEPSPEEVSDVVAAQPAED